VAVHLRQRYVHLSLLCAAASSYAPQTLGHIETEFSEQLDWLFYFQVGVLYIAHTRGM
jgi:hypothetical protein